MKPIGSRLSTFGYNKTLLDAYAVCNHTYPREGATLATRQTTTLRPTFNGSLSIEARPERLSAHAGVLLLRELDQRLGLLGPLADSLHDPRDPSRILHPLVELLRQRVFLIAAGRNHQDDSDQLREDPACRLAVSQSRGVTPLLSPADGPKALGLSSQPSQSRLLDILATEDNLQALRTGLFDSALRSLRAEGESSRIARAVLDVDSFPIEAHGHQPGSAYNGHYRCQCFHPLAVFLSDSAHFLDLDLRPGNVHTSDRAVDTIVSCLDRIEEIAPTAAVRGDAGFPSEELMSTLEAREVEYALRVRKNSRLEELALPFLRRPAGRPPREPRTWCHNVWYRAQTWSRHRRVVIVVEEVPGELFLRWYAIVTSWNPVVRSGEDILEFYRARGTMEAHLGELIGLDPALSSTLRPKSHVGGRAPEARGTVSTQPPLGAAPWARRYRPRASVRGGGCPLPGLLPPVRRQRPDLLRRRHR